MTQLYKFVPIDQVNLEELEDNKRYTIKFKNDNSFSMFGEDIKVAHPNFFNMPVEILIPLKPISDEDIEEHFNRKNVFGLHHKGLINGAKWYKNELNKR